MQSLEKRIAELEKSQPSNDGVKTIIIRFISPGGSDDELQALHSYSGGQHWTRDPSESEQNFIDRATRQVKRKGPGCALLMAGDMEKSMSSNGDE